MRATVLLFFLLCASGPWAQEPDPQQNFQDAAQAQQRGDLVLAVSKYQEVIRLDPNVVAAHANLGVVLVSLGRYDEAITQYHIALAEAQGRPRRPPRCDLTGQLPGAIGSCRPGRCSSRAARKSQS